VHGMLHGVTFDSSPDLPAKERLAQHAIVLDHVLSDPDLTARYNDHVLALAKAFALVQDIRGAFRKAGDTQDTDMQEQSAEEKVVSVNSDADMDEEHAKRRFYERDVEYDIGLEGGTLISIDDSAMNEPNSAIKGI